jgi:hypothetical protein
VFQERRLEEHGMLHLDNVQAEQLGDVVYGKSLDEGRKKKENGA